jgi:hypothetical protein
MGILKIIKADPNQIPPSDPTKTSKKNKKTKKTVELQTPTEKSQNQSSLRRRASFADRRTYNGCNERYWT